MKSIIQGQLDDIALAQRLAIMAKMREESGFQVTQHTLDVRAASKRIPQLSAQVDRLLQRPAKGEFTAAFKRFMEAGKDDMPEALAALEMVVERLDA